VGALTNKYISASFAKVFGLLYQSGVAVIPCLEITKNLHDNAVYQKEIQNFIQGITEGQSLSETFNLF
jgi:type II secretory pathway component PulF